jgi:hypothetical protein
VYLLVQPHGARLWRLKYRLGGRERSTRSAHDEVGLEAHSKRSAARKLIADSKDPQPSGPVVATRAQRKG